MEIPPSPEKDKASLAYRAAALAVNNTYRLIPGLKLTSSGLDNLPLSDPFILAATHHNAWDVPAIGTVVYKEIKRPIYFLTEEKLLAQGTFSGNILTPMHALPIRRNGRPDLSQIRQTVEAATAGHILGIFPEGGRVDGDKIAEELKGGVGFIALRASVPVIPAAIAGRNWRFGRKSLPYIPRSLHVHISEPIEVDGPSKAHTKAFDKTLGHALQASLDEAYNQYSKIHGPRAARRLDH